MKSIEKLRGELQICANAKTRPTIAYMEDIADEIEREVAERYMELPVDADGVPIRVGDELCGYGLPDGGAVVKSLNSHMVIVGGLEGGENYAKYGLLWDAKEARHVKPRTLEDVLRDCCNEWNQHCGKDWEQGVYGKYAAEICELLGVY